MLSLTKKLSNSILTDIGDVSFNLAYNNVLNWYELVDSDKELSEKISGGWSIFFNQKLSFDTNHVSNYEIAADALSNLSTYISQDPYLDGKSNFNEDKQSNKQETNKWFSYQKDAEAIYASFLFDYKIDLIDQQDKLRWEKFRALFNNLSAKSPIMRIVNIRKADRSDYTGKSLTDLDEAQNYYSLDSSVATANSDMNNMFTMLKGIAVKPK